MSETEQVTSETPETIAEEKTLLLQRARIMGLKVSNNIGVDTLREKVRKALEAGTRPSEAGDSDDADESAAEPAPVPRRAAETKEQKRSRIQKQAMRLVRIRVTCLNPNKKDLPGEIFTVANRYIGTVRKYVPFGDATRDGYHVPQCIYDHMRERVFLSIRTRKGKHDSILTESTDTPEFAIEVLPQLTREELRKLALKQAMAAGEITQ